MRFCKRLHINSKYIISVLVCVLLPAMHMVAQDQTPSAASDSIQTTSPKINNTDSIPTDTLNAPAVKKQKIDAAVSYTAQDSIVFWGNGTGFLYGQGDVNYKKMNLKADLIRVRMDSSTIYAQGRRDSTGNFIGKPVFKEGDSEYSSKEMTYNLKTKKGFIRQGVTQQGEGYIISERTKKDSTNTLYIQGAKYTTCDNHDHPHFYLSLSKGKMQPGNYVVSGPAHLVVADVPLPLVIPFGFFPFTSQYSSGILMPTYADDLNAGFGLLNGGYYFAINDYMDFELRSEIYTKGTWSVKGSSSYVKRYKFRGSFSASYREDVRGEKDMPDYSKAKSMSIQWSHTQDPKADPYSTLSAGVNFSTSGYNQSNINSYYRPELNSANTTSSSISYTKRFPSIPALSISTNVMVSQRTKDSTISMTLPNLSISYSSTKPFKRKNPIGGERWYEKITLSYSGSFSNSIQTKESLLLSSSFVRDWSHDIRHSIPISATFNLFDNINITPNISYEEKWFLQSFRKSWDVARQKEVVDTTSGFNRAYQFNAGISASTKIYGFFTPLIGKKYVEQIRHVITPSLSFSYRPNFGDPMWDYYHSYTRLSPNAHDPSQYDEQEIIYSRFKEAFPSRGESRSISFSLANNLEMKVPNPNDTTGKEASKKISLIDNFSISSAYNFAADSMNLSNFSVSLRLKIGKQTISLNGVFDPYMYGLNASGNPVRINQFRWNHGKFPKFLGMSYPFSYTLNNDTFKKLRRRFQKEEGGKGKDKTEDNPEASETEGSEEPRKDKETANETDNDGYEKVPIPWSISINYNVSYGNTTFDRSKMDYDMGFTHHLNLSGNISLGNNWSASTSISYDFQAKQFSYTNVNVKRNLHCWSMTASFVPFGRYKSYNFKIGVNASMLQDLKYEKQTRAQQATLNWY